jgi:hypothetical protein
MERCHVNESLLIQYLIVRARVLAASFRDDERGETTEKVILTAVFAALAIAVGAIIVSKVTAKASNINLQ